MSIERSVLADGPIKAGADILYAKGYSNAVRCKPGQRFEQLFEDRVDILAASDPAHLAIDSTEGKLTFADLDGRANQLARYLKRLGLGSGDRLALLFDKSIFSYVATLAVLKLNAAYVPLDASFPADRIAFIAEDASVKSILSMARYREHLAPTGVSVLHLDEQRAAIAAEPSHRLSAEERGEPVEDLAYIIYTSGSTGKPKGVPIDHDQIVNFILVAAEVYGIEPTDRMYQGLTIAFDFAVEEIWVPLVVGATLVPGPTGSRLLGRDLGDFLAEQNITALCCVPTLLATLEAELPLLRYIMVSGEACPQDLVARWQKPGRRFLNAYGPTEATVTATLNELVAGKPVTIGGPLPTYAIVILDPNEPRVLPFGEAGEIGIAGIGVARGYLNRDELTQKVFIPDFLDIPENTSGHIYRTGDLARINADGEIEYMGRIDTQVKIRGYRIELTEIESVLMQHPDIAQAVVNKYEPEPGAVELAAYYTLKPGVAALDLAGMVDGLKTQVPTYMVPAYFEQLALMPLLPSHKADRKKLPAPSGPRYSARSGAYVAPEGDMEQAIAQTLAEFLKLPQVSAEDHFFDDLGANSLLMAQFSSRLRDQASIPDISMRDIYLNPTVRKLAAASVAQAASSGPNVPADDQPVVLRVTSLQFYLCGAAQLLWTFGYVALTTYIGIEALVWTMQAIGPVDIYLRGVAATLGIAATLVALPIALKWLLVGRFKPETIAVWSWSYFRFWVLKGLIRTNPMVLFVGTPLYLVYLRLLGASIGHRVVILSQHVPVCADLISVGDDTVIHKDALFNGYRARAGVIETGIVSIGRRAYVAEATVFDIDTAMGNDTQLGTTSALHRYQTVPDGKRYHGSPGQETQVNYIRVAPLRVGKIRRVAYTILQLLLIFAIAPISLAVLYAAFPTASQLAYSHLDGPNTHIPDAPTTAAVVVAVSLVTYALALIGGLLTIGMLPRLLNLMIKPDRVYPLYGFHHVVFGLISGISNSRAFNLLFGDSSAIVHYLRYIGYDLGQFKQTGSNFGAVQKHDTPFLCGIGVGTLVADGLAMINADMSSTSFKLSRVEIGADNYLGNNIFYPAGGMTGENVLLATKVQVPIEGMLHENIGLLGSPSFQIPRSVKRDAQFEALKSGPEFPARLKAKNRANLRTAMTFMATRWFLGFLGLLSFIAAVAVQDQIGTVSYAIAALVMIFAGVGFNVLIERLSLQFGSLQPKYCSIYDPYYWHHENHWKMSDTAFGAPFNGTPFKSLIWRMLGVKVGRRLFDDGGAMSERTLVEIGDDVTIGELAMIQPHTMEDGAFKTDRIKIGNGVTIGANAFINYGVVMGDNAFICSKRGGIQWCAGGR